jgi:hypothetical protein
VGKAAVPLGGRVMSARQFVNLEQSFPIMLHRRMVVRDRF